MISVPFFSSITFTTFATIKLYDGSLVPITLQFHYLSLSPFTIFHGYNLLSFGKGTPLANIELQAKTRISHLQNLLIIYRELQNAYTCLCVCLQDKNKTLY